MKLFSVFSWPDLGIKPIKRERSQEQFEKLTKMVMEKNYKHPEIGILRHSDLNRMNVPSNRL